jgi:hypothetical protein
MLQTYTWEQGDYARQSWANGYKIHLTLTEESIDGNASVVSYKFWISNGKENVVGSNPYNWSISIGGKTIYINNFSFRLAAFNSTQTIASGQVRVEHNSDGTKRMPFSVSIPNVKAETEYGPPSMYIAESWTLTTIQSPPPIITASVIDTNAETIALTGDNRKLIRFFSIAYASMSATAQGDASIDQDLYVIRNGNRVEYGTEATFDSVESNTFTFSAQDSKGSIGSKTVAPTMVNYVRLTCDIENTRPDASGNMDVRCTGMYFSGSFGAVENTLSVYCRYKVQGAYEWSDPIEMTIVPNGNYYGAYASFVIEDYDYRNAYVFDCIAQDKLTTYSSMQNAVKSLPVFHWGENDFVFEVPVTFNAGSSDAAGDKTIDGNLKVEGDLRLNDGNALRFGDGSYCIIEANDGGMLIRATTIDLEANSVSVYGFPIPVIEKGRWTPTINETALSYYTKQEGWYSKVGQTVSVGFYIKATCRSGYQNTSINIDGLPFTPMFSAAGGGMCSGAYVSGGFTFQCFVAETSGIITTRVQACNNTSATNLTTSSTGCNYRDGGGEITLSGTITFMSYE